MSTHPWIHPPRLWPSDSHATGRRVTWLELFFDLVFVAAVAQVDAPLVNDYTVAGIGRFFAFFLLIWWAWTGHTIYSTRFDTDDVVQRVLTLLQMFAVAAMAANAKDAFSSVSSAGFGAAYAAMRVILVLQYVRARRVPESRQLTTHYALGFGAAAAVWLVSAVVPTPWRYWMWAVALLIDLGTPVLAVRHAERFPPDAAHLPERFGLFTIILLGESIVAVMHGMESQPAWSVPAALCAFQGMAIAFCFWWWYFDGASGASMRHVQTRRQAKLFHIWSYAHLPMYLGIAIVAIGIKHIISLQPSARLQPAEAWIFCAAVALVMLAITTLSFTSDSRGNNQRLTARLLPQYLLASLVLAAGTIGDRVLPVSLVSGVTMACILQVFLSTPEPFALHESAVSEAAPAFGSESQGE
jgi:low temperature requirement protein LtrA